MTLPFATVDADSRQAATIPAARRRALLEHLPPTAARDGSRVGRKSITLALPFGSTPLDSEAGREFLQERLALFAKLLFGLGGFAFIATSAILFGIPNHDLVTCFLEHGKVPQLVAVGVSLVTWLVTRRGVLPLRALFAIDAASSLVALSAYALMTFQGAQHAAQGIELVMMLVTMCLLTLRAVIVPSTPGHTLLVGSVGSVPVLALAHYAALHFPRQNFAMPSFIPVAYIGVWTVLALAISGLTSQVIYGLRKQVEQAQRLGQYVLDEKIGEGGMGMVYKARHGLLRRPTAIKLVLPERAGAHTLLRFEREVQLTAMLTHPNTVSIYDYGRTPEGVFYYAMEYLDGINLEELVGEFGPQPPARVIHILQQVAGSLAEAHSVGLVHRDIKPANIILCDRAGVPDMAKVVDFGLVKDVSTLGRGKPTLSSVNAIIGTPLYIAPEAVAAPDQVDGRADLYALGAVAYFLLTGQPVFLGSSVVEVCAQHLHAKPTPPSLRLGQAIPERLEGLILQCLAKRPEDRPATATELLKALSTIAGAAWTADDAREWWTLHGAKARAGGRTRRSTLGELDTVLVDLTNRSADAR